MVEIVCVGVGGGVGWGEGTSVVCGPESQAPAFPKAHRCGLWYGRPGGAWRTVWGVGGCLSSMSADSSGWISAPLRPSLSLFVLQGSQMSC